MIKICSCDVILFKYYSNVSADRTDIHMKSHCIYLILCVCVRARAHKDKFFFNPNGREVNNGNMNDI